MYLYIYTYTYMWAAQATHAGSVADQNSPAAAREDAAPAGPASTWQPTSVPGAPTCSTSTAMSEGMPMGMLGLGVATFVAVGLGVWLAKRRGA